MTKIPYEIPAEIRDLTAKSVEEARKAFGSFIEAAHKATAQAEGTANALQSSAKDVSAKALSFTEGEFEGGVRSRPEAHSSEGSPGNPRPSGRICEEAARRHGGACEGAGHRCPEGRDAGQVITTFISQGQPNGTPRKEIVAALQTCGTLAARRQQKPYGKGAW